MLFLEMPWWSICSQELWTVFDKLSQAGTRSLFCSEGLNQGWLELLESRRGRRRQCLLSVVASRVNLEVPLVVVVSRLGRVANLKCTMLLKVRFRCRQAYFMVMQRMLLQLLKLVLSRTMVSALQLAILTHLQSLGGTMEVALAALVVGLMAALEVTLMVTLMVVLVVMVTVLVGVLMDPMAQMVVALVATLTILVVEVLVPLCSIATIRR